MAITEFQGEYRWLSNFAPSVVDYEWVNYPTVENAYQAAKTANPEDRIQFVSVTPGQAKRLGKTIQLRSNWDEYKHCVMGGLLYQKFSEEPFRGLLLATGDQELIEGNHWGDTYWGVCKGVGENWLGKTIMQVRDKLKEELSLLK